MKTVLSKKTMSRRPIQFGLRHVLFGMIVIAGLIWSMKLGFSNAKHNIEATKSSYAALLVARMCVEHMKANELAWPKNWDELHDHYESCRVHARQSWTFQDLKKRVAIDWHAEPRHLAEDSECIIWVATDPNFEFHGLSPNQILLQFVDSVESSNR